VRRLLASLRKLEREFERVRFEMQQDRVRRLFAEIQAEEGLEFTDARRILWMYSSVMSIACWSTREGGPCALPKWLSETLVTRSSRADRRLWCGSR